MSRLQKLIPLTTVLLLLSFCGELFAQDKVPAEQVLPTGTFAMMSVPSVQEAKARYHDTVWSDVFTNPEMAGFWNALTEPMIKELDNLKAEVGVDWRELMTIPTGEVTLSVARVKRGMIGVSMSIEYGEDATKVEKLLTVVEENLEKAEKTQQTVEFEDTPVVYYELSPEGTLPNRKQQLAWFQRDGYLVISNQTEALEDILLRWSGENSEVLAELEDFKYIRERCRVGDVDPVMYWYVNPVKGVQASLEIVGSTGMATFAAVAPLLGVNQLKAIGGSMDLATEHYEEVTQTVIYADSPQVGLLKLFQAKEIAIQPPEWVSAESESFMIYHWQLEEALLAAKKMIDFFQPGAFDQVMNQLAEHPGAQGLHPQKDFLDLLEGTIAVEVTPPVTGDADDPAATLVALQVKDEERMRDVLAKVQSLEGSSLKVREFQGKSIYSLPIAEQVGELSLALTQSSLFITNSTPRMEQLLRGGDSYPRLKDSKKFEELASEAPEAAGIWGMQQSGAQLERLSQQISQLMSRSTPAGEDSQNQKVLENFPKPEVLKKYAVDSFYYVVEDERGVYWKNYSLRQK
ncbi:MAG: hypothetical protein HUJ26_01140 [Planctomycetaceae bacterium]|nr:hypothetical protein [Planctomycetaceae bacterium]